MEKYTFLLDFDDTFVGFNDYACALANEDVNVDNEEPFTIQEIEEWDKKGRIKVINNYYKNPELYRRQTQGVTEENKAAVRKLMEYGEVFFETAPYPEFMSTRVSQILEIFPEMDAGHIILGSAKHLVQGDFSLDDNIDNVLSSPAKYPVLFRRPWNRDMTGLLSVNTLEEFVCLVESIIFPQKPTAPEIPSVICLVGPSGSGKNDVADSLVQLGGYERPVGFTTNPADSKRVYISEEEFEKKDFLEKTRYAGYAYGIEKESVQAILDRGEFPVIPIDICGAIGMKMVFPTITIYLKRGKKDLVSSIISDDSLSDKEKTLRILSLDAEQKNELICDMTINSDDAVKKIAQMWA